MSNLQEPLYCQNIDNNNYIYRITRVSRFEYIIDILTLILGLFNCFLFIILEIFIFDFYNEKDIIKKKDISDTLRILIVILVFTVIINIITCLTSRILRT